VSDDLGIPKKFSYPNFQQLSLRFQRTSSSTNQMRLYRPCDIIKIS